MKEVIERCNWLVNKCNDKAITPDVKDDFRYLLEEIERLNNRIAELEKGVSRKEEQITDLDDENFDLENEIERLNNIINELEKELDKGFEVYICNGRKAGKSIELGYKICQKELLNKLQKLKGSDKE